MKHIRTYSGIILLCTMVLFVTACANPEIPPEATATPVPSVAVRPEQTPTPTPEPTATSTLAPTVTVAPTLTQAPVTPTPVPGLSEAELLEQLTSAAGVVPESYWYADFDHNGTNELFATLAVDYLYQVWYCNSDGTVCEKAYESYGYFDACEMTDIENAAINETHIVINLYNMMGTNKQFSILALRDTGVVCLVPWNYGTAGTDTEGAPCMTVEAYDGSYDAASGMWLMHTWKQTWLVYDEAANTYKEIPAKKISEEEFLKFANAAECLELIRTQEIKEDTADISFEYFCRSNGVLHVQCFVTDTSGNIAAKYYTSRVVEDTIVSREEWATDGIMQERLSGLEAVE